MMTAANRPTSSHGAAGRAAAVVVDMAYLKSRRAKTVLAAVSTRAMYDRRRRHRQAERWPRHRQPVHHLILDVEGREVGQQVIDALGDGGRHRRVDRGAEVAQVGAEMPRHPDPEREQRRQQRARERRKEERHRRHQRELQQRETDRQQQPQVEGRRPPALLDPVDRGEVLVEQHRVEGHRHHRQVDDQRQHESEELAQQEPRPGHRLRQHAVDAAPLDFLGHEAGADEQRDEQSHHVHRGQAEVLDDLQVLRGSEPAHEKRRGHQHHREEHHAVGDAVAHRLLEDGQGDGADGGDVHSCAVSRAAVAATCWTKYDSRVSRTGLSDSTCAPAADSSRSTASGGSGGSSTV